MRLILLLLALITIPFTASAETDAGRTQELLGLQYIPASYQSLSQATWRFNMHDISNDDAIDEYIKLSNCDLYDDYFDHDFLWQRIREGMRREIRYYAGSFPDRFQMVGGIELGRYDFKTSSFLVPENYQLNKAGFLEIPATDAFEGKCSLSGLSTIFPPYIRLAADNPFSLLQIPVPPHEARPLIERLGKYKYQNITSDRMAVMRVRVRLTGIREYNPSTIHPRVIFKGQLDDIAIFEDPAMTKLIWQKSFKDLN